MVMDTYSNYTLQRTREVIGLATGDLSRRLSIRQLARKVGVNSRALQDSFKFLYGKTIFEYVQALRIARAKELLKTTDLTTEEIAWSCGYREPSNFSLAFKKMTGCWPGAWRKQI